MKEFETDISDYAPSITVSVDVEAAYGSNEYYEDISIDKEGKCTINPDDNPRTSYSYKRIGMIKPNIHKVRLKFVNLFFCMEQKVYHNFLLI